MPLFDNFIDKMQGINGDVKKLIDSQLQQIAGGHSLALNLGIN
jgi:hypothetical protein